MFKLSYRRVFQSPKGRLQTQFIFSKKLHQNLFQSPKGRLQTSSGKAAGLKKILFQSPKGRLQTDNCFYKQKEAVKFQSPKGRLQTISTLYILQTIPVSIPKGKATNYIDLCETGILLFKSFNPQREGYKQEKASMLIVII